MVQLIVLLLSLCSYAKVDRIHSEAYLGEKRLDSYSERFQPLVYQDLYQGKMSFADEIFFQNFFRPFLFDFEQDYSNFFRSELKAGMSCSNELLSKHFDQIRYAYRLITLSYMLEGQWHNSMLSKHFRFKKGCEFDLKSWAQTCRTKSAEMTKFIKRLVDFSPQIDEKLPADYKIEHWWKEFKSENHKWYSQYRLQTECLEGCSESNIEKKLNGICESDKEVMTLICSEDDEIYGLSSSRDAYFLLGQSNIINTFNNNGEALGCLRRFSEVMAHKEVQYEVLKQLFPALQNFLKLKYSERFLQGRAFFLGSGKEFEEKGLSDLYVKDQPIKIEKPLKQPEKVIVQTPKKIEIKPEAPIPAAEVVKETPRRVVVKEIKQPVKSAFLQASEIRQSQNLARVEVDMAKFKYDYSFSLNMINILSERLKSFMTRDALVEMMNYDKLGTKEGPVPLTFLKYMIDMNEHHGLWNITSTLGDKFYVSNEIDSSYSPTPEYIELVNNQSTGGQWQIFILRP